LPVLVVAGVPLLPVPPLPRGGGRDVCAGGEDFVEVVVTGGMCSVGGAAAPRWLMPGESHPAIA